MLCYAIYLSIYLCYLSAIAIYISSDPMSFVFGVLLVCWLVLTNAPGKNLLYFGCRSRKADYLYGDELGTFSLFCGVLRFVLQLMPVVCLVVRAQRLGLPKA
jgi:hypothetical protein